ncbi:MAG: hypothetical protein A3J29_06255 [Acidobacteria bacterium RIFCSPLOWO2_12_FULL_67_14b]|nr:MAG: hypothetical protein A3J29_06255 [Acidobacteria bacterium RIFCSPLOWO2_12_FULL_67_14b]
MGATLRQYGGRMIMIDERPTVQLIDTNDNARRRFQYRRTLDGTGIERRVLAHDGRPFRDTGSPWEPLSWLDIAALEAVRGTYHPILDPLGL